MTVTLSLPDTVAEQLTDLDLGEAQGLDGKLLALVAAEYRRRLARYRLTDRRLSEKYGLSFAAFESGRTTERLGYSWEVESDAMAWETAVDGIETVESKLRALMHELA